MTQFKDKAGKNRELRSTGRSWPGSCGATLDHPRASGDNPPAREASIMKRIFSGVQPTGNLHLGNYLGAIKNFVALQDDYDCIYCVVDMHAITMWQDPAVLTANTREVAAAYLAAGVDPKRCIIFNQSQVSVHAQLAWIFNCVARLGWLNRMTQFKDKAGKNREQASVGLYAYPNLMAADLALIEDDAALGIDPGGLDGEHARSRGGVPGRRGRSQALHHLQSKPGQRSRAAGLDIQLRGAAGLAQPHDPIQGQGREESRVALDRAELARLLRRNS